MSKQLQHSPGPFTFHRPGWYIEDSDGNAIAEVNSAYPGDGQIFAAAPEMLRLLRVLVPMSESGAEDREGWMAWNAALNEASELIARLDGDA